MLGSGQALGVLEQAMRAALASAGGRLLQAVLAGEDGYAGPHAGCGNGHQAVYAGCRDKTVTTVLGPVRLTRAWYHCGQCGHGFAPRDQQLGVAGASLSPGLAEMTALAGAEVSFGRARGNNGPDSVRQGRFICDRTRTDEHQPQGDGAAVACHEQLRSDLANKTNGHSLLDDTGHVL